MPPEHDSDTLLSVIEALTDVIVFKDAEGRWRVANAAARRFFGLEQGVWRGLTDAELAVRHPLLAATFSVRSRSDADAWAQGEAIRMEARMPDLQTDETRIFAVVKTPLYHADGTRRGLLVRGRDVTAQRRLEASQRRRHQNMRRLGELAALSHLPLKARFGQALALVSRHLGLELGIISHIDGQRYEVAAQVSPDHELEAGQVFALGDTYCSLTIAQDGVVAIRDMQGSRYRGHPCYQAFGLATYIGAPIRVRGQVYGTVNFSSPNPYERDFDEGDREFMELLGRWAGSAIEHEEMERRLLESERKLRTIIELEPECVKLLDTEGRVLQINPAGLAILGVDDPGLVLHEPVIQWVVADDRDAFQGLIGEVFQGDPGRLEYRIEDHKGRLRWLETSAVPFRNAQGEITTLLAITRDVTERKQVELEHQRLAFVDPLTRLGNRRFLLQRLQAAMPASARSGNHGALFFIDLDRFKRINDVHGHEDGDQVLKIVAERLRAAVRSADTLSRFGGDEFVLLLEGLDADETAAAHQAQGVAEKIRREIGRVCVVGPQRHQVTPSIGIRLFQGDCADGDRLLQQADQALYQAKAAGRDSCCLFGGGGAERRR